MTVPPPGAAARPSPSAARGGGLLGAAAMIAAVTVVARRLGFGRWLAQAAAVGDGAIGDAYNSANLLPNVLFEIAAGGALAGAVVPVLAGLVQRGDRDQVDKLVAATLGWTLLVLVPLGGLLAAVSGPIATVLAGDDALVPVIQYFLLVFAVQVPLYGTAVLLYGVLQAHHRFFWPAFAPALASIVTIAAYLVYGRLAGGEVDDPAELGAGALQWLAWGTTAGVAAMVVPLLGPVRAAGVRLRLSLRFPAGAGRRVLGLAASGVGGLVAQQLAFVVAMLVANARGGDGTYTVYAWTQAVYLLPYAVLVVPLATSTFPRLAAAAEDRPRFARLTAATTRGVLVAGGLGAAALVAVAPAVMVVFLTIRAPDDATSTVQWMSSTLVLMAPGVVGYGILFHVSRALFALDLPRSAVLGVATGWGTVAVAAVVLSGSGPASPQATLRALGLSMSLGMTVGAVLLLVLLHRAAGRGVLTGLPRTAGTLAVAGTAGAGAGYLATLAAGGLAMPWQPETVATLEPYLQVGLLRAVLAALAGGVVALAVTLGGVLLADRGTLLGLRAAQRVQPDQVGTGDHDTPGARGADDGAGPDVR